MTRANVSEKKAELHLQLHQYVRCVPARVLGGYQTVVDYKAEAKRALRVASAPDASVAKLREALERLSRFD